MNKNFFQMVECCVCGDMCFKSSMVQASGFYFCGRSDCHSTLTCSCTCKEYDCDINCKCTFECKCDYDCFCHTDAKEKNRLKEKE